MNETPADDWQEERIEFALSVQNRLKETPLEVGQARIKFSSPFGLSL